MYYPISTTLSTTNLQETSNESLTALLTLSPTIFLSAMICPGVSKPHKSHTRLAKAAQAIFHKGPSPLSWLVAKSSSNGWSDFLKYQSALFVKLMRHTTVNSWRLVLCRTNVASCENTLVACDFSNKLQCAGSSTMQRGRSLLAPHTSVAQLIRALRVMTSKVAGLNPARRVIAQAKFA